MGELIGVTRPSSPEGKTMHFDLTELVRMARRWWWLLLLAPLLGGAILYYVGKSQQPMYQATATLWVELAPGPAGPDPGLIEGSINLAETYRHLMTAAPILSPIIADLGLPYGLDELRGRLSVSVVRGTPLIEVTASDAQPARAAAIADAVVRRFGDSVTELGITNAAPAPTNPDAAPAEPLIVRTVPAEVPHEPYAPRTTLFALFGAALGLLVAVGAVGFVGYLGKSLRVDVNSAARTQKSPLMGVRQAPNLQGGRD
jgi:polysaccharide biosynthesis transport protein